MGRGLRARDELLDREVEVKILLAVPTARPTSSASSRRTAHLQVQHPGYRRLRWGG